MKAKHMDDALQHFAGQKPSHGDVAKYLGTTWGVSGHSAGCWAGKVLERLKRRGAMARRAKLGKLANDAHAAREELMTVLASIEALAGEPEYLPELGEAAAAAYGAISKAPLAPLLLRIHNLPGPLG